MKKQKQRLLVSVRGPKEAQAAIKGGAHIADVEYPASALGTPYPPNIAAVRKAIPKSAAVATTLVRNSQGDQRPAKRLLVSP